MIASLCNDPNKKTREQTIAREVADEFIDSLEEVLRVEEEANEFVLAGHSLGGFLAAKYALKYPKSVTGKPIKLKN